MLELHHFPISKTAKLASYSPFCLKTELFLRACSIPYKSVWIMGSPSKAPRGKLPFIKYENQTIPDSEQIIDFLTHKLDKNPDAHLNENELALSWSLKRLIEDSLAPLMAYYRWVDKRYWPRTKAAFFPKLPVGLGQVIPAVVRAPVVKRFKNAGISDYSEPERIRIFKRGLETLSFYLGQSDFFFGDNVSNLDFSAFGLLANILRNDLTPNLNELVAAFPNLVNYVERLSLKYFPERGQ